MSHYETEDTPLTLSYQLELMNNIGFSKTILLHKHFNFAAFGALKKPSAISHYITVYLELK
jgi:hypothetical protein